MAHRFPTEFPGAEMQVLIGALVGSKPTTHDAVEAGWWVAGYAAEQALHGDTPLMFESGDMTRQQLAGQLQACHDAAAAEGAQPSTVGALPWAKLLGALLKVLPLLFAEAQV